MIGQGSGAVAAGIGALMFGVLFAWAVYAPLHGKHAGYTSLLVVIGTMGTLAFFGLAYGFEMALRVGLFFVATGGPMILGEAIRTKHEELTSSREIASEIEELLKE